MITLRIPLIALSVSALAFVTTAHARLGNTPGGYYVTTCKTTEQASQQKLVCTIMRGCHTVLLPVKKVTTCTKKWVDPHAV